MALLLSYMGIEFIWAFSNLTPLFFDSPKFYHGTGSWNVPRGPCESFPWLPFAPFFKGGVPSGDHVFKTVSLFEQFPTISVRFSGIDFVYILSKFHKWRHFFHFWLNSSGATPIVFPISQCKTNGFGCPCFIRHFVFITPHFMLNILAFYGSAAIVCIVVL